MIRLSVACVCACCFKDSSAAYNDRWLCCSATSSSDEDSAETLPFQMEAPPLQSASLLDSVLIAEWEDRYERGLFRYDVTACPTKPVPGAYGFIAQLNEGRSSKKRPTEFTADKVQ